MRAHEMSIEDIQGRKSAVKGGGACIYCGSDGGLGGLHDEHIIPYSLGGKAQLLKASCSDCEGVASYLDEHITHDDVPSG